MDKPVFAPGQWVIYKHEDGDEPTGAQIIGFEYDKIEGWHYLIQTKLNNDVRIIEKCILMVFDESVNKWQSYPTEFRVRY